MCFRIKIHVDVETVSYCHAINKSNGGKTNRSQSKYASWSLVVYHYEVLNLNTNISRSGSPVCKRWLILNAPLLKNNCNGALSPSSHSGVLVFVTRVMEGQAIAGVLGDAPNHIMLTMLILHLQASR